MHPRLLPFATPRTLACCPLPRHAGRLDGYERMVSSGTVVSEGHAAPKSGGAGAGGYTQLGVMALGEVGADGLPPDWSSGESANGNGTLMRRV